jgi:hypothetical protein
VGNRNAVNNIWCAPVPENIFIPDIITTSAWGKMLQILAAKLAGMRHRTLHDLASMDAC